MIAIIGAGPAGAYTAYLLAKAGNDVHIFEDHDVIGEPVSCTGLLTKSILEFVSIEELAPSIVNTLTAVDLVAPSGKTVRMPTHEYVVDRVRFDRMLVEKAVAAGAQLHLGHKFVGRKGGLILLRHNGRTITREATVLIGADGPLSEVAKQTGLFGERRFYVGLQATVKGTYEKGTFKTWFGPQAPDFFCWSVPESSTTSRVGLATMTDARGRFERFMAKMPGEITARQAGPIPVFDRRLKASNATERVYLVGDAAALVKATTGGGIVTGMLSGRVLADCLINKKEYERSLAPLRKELRLHLAIRKALDRFTVEDYELLMTCMENPGLRDVLSRNPREFPSRFMLKVMIAQPRLLLFAPKVLTAIMRS